MSALPATHNPSHGMLFQTLTLPILGGTRPLTLTLTPTLTLTLTLDHSAVPASALCRAESSPWH